MLLIGPTLLAGIGQMLHKYTHVFEGAKYVTIDKVTPDIFNDHEEVIVFALPIPGWIQTVPVIKKFSKKVHCMTICETETVHESYGDLFEHFDRVIVASDFCKKIFSRQFPKTEFIVLRAHVPLPQSVRIYKTFEGIPLNKYIFYHIGNVLDQRKNTNKIIEAFIRCEFGDSAVLVLKATCMQPVQIKVPNVIVINGLIPQNELDSLHFSADCYVSFSSSEGIGMGAVEAALHNKPVIITEYGGAVEYIKTPYTIKCDLQEIPCDDFLFKKGMLWGKPDFEQLKTFMNDAYSKRLTYMDHEHTKQLVSVSEIYKTWQSM
jgi:glycosyltransferase involved in cell wall biosynthesis